MSGSRYADEVHSEYISDPLWPEEIPIELRWKLRNHWKELDAVARRLVSWQVKSFLWLSLAFPLLLLTALGVIHGTPYPIDQQLLLFLSAGCVVLTIGITVYVEYRGLRARAIFLYSEGEGLVFVLQKLHWRLRAKATMPDSQPASEVAFETAIVEEVADSMLLDELGLLDRCEKEEADRSDADWDEAVKTGNWLVERGTVTDDSDIDYLRKAISTYPLSKVLYYDILKSNQLYGRRLVPWGIGTLVLAAILVGVGDGSIQYSDSWDPLMWNFAVIASLWFAAYLFTALLSGFLGGFVPIFTVGISLKERFLSFLMFLMVLILAGPFFFMFVWFAIEPAVMGI